MITWLWGAESFRTNWLQSSKNILLKTTTTHGVENVLPMGCCGINWHPTSLPSSQRCVSRQDGGQQMWTGIHPAAALIPKSTGRPFPSSALVSKSKTSKHNFLCGLSAHPDPFFISRDVFIPLKQELMPMLNSWFAAAVFFFFLVERFYWWCVKKDLFIKTCPIPNGKKMLLWAPAESFFQRERTINIYSLCTQLFWVKLKCSPKHSPHSKQSETTRPNQGLFQR